MKNKATKIGGIAIGILAGISVLSHIYNAGTRKAYIEGRTKGFDETFDLGYETGCDAVLLRMSVDGIIDNVQFEKYMKEFVRK